MGLQFLRNHRNATSTILTLIMKAIVAFAAIAANLVEATPYGYPHYGYNPTVPTMPLPYRPYPFAKRHAIELFEPNDYAYDYGDTGYRHDTHSDEKQYRLTKRAVVPAYEDVDP